LRRLAALTAGNAGSDKAIAACHRPQQSSGGRVHEPRPGRAKIADALPLEVVGRPTTSTKTDAVHLKGALGTQGKSA
jgi:hypothetical protein